MSLHRVDDGIDGPGKAVPALPVGKQIDIAAQPVAHAMSTHGVSASQRKALFSGCFKCDLSDLAVAGIHC